MNAFLRIVMVMVILCGFLTLAFPSNGYSVTALSVQFEDTLHLVNLDMTRKQIVETLGTPDVIKSDGMCLQYEYLGISVYLNKDDRIEQIYLARDFHGSIGRKSQPHGISLSDLQTEFGAPASHTKLNYQPSPLIQNKATTETENMTEPTGKPKEEFPLQYPGNKKLYIFYNEGRVIKYKYVLDDDGIAFWLDQNQKLYSTVLYMSRDEKAAHDASLASAGELDGTGKKRLAVIHFDFDKYNIKKLAIPIIDDHVAYLKQHASLPVLVEGHTDYMGSDAYNQKLSEQRATSVRDYLVQKGIASARIQVRGYGESRPAADNKTAEGRAINRRAELAVPLEK
jgi:outer membrane protein OmpA-like peptidoglycan-associated protein